MAGFTQDKPESPLAVQRRRHKAEATMGIKRGETYDAEKVKALFATIAKAMHPDSSGSAPLHCGYILDEVRKAKDELLRQLKGSDND